MSEARPADYQQAERLFRAFHGREPGRGEIVELAGFNATALEVGTAVSVGYAALGEKFYHEFEGNRPRLFVSADGAQAFLLGGIYRFTERGFLK